MLQFSKEVTESPMKIQGKDRQKTLPLTLCAQVFETF